MNYYNILILKEPSPFGFAKQINMDYRPPDWYNVRRMPASISDA